MINLVKRSRFIVLLVLALPLAGCDPKCWPLCSSSTSGITDDATTTTTASTTDTTTTTTTTTTTAASCTSSTTSTASITAITLTKPNGGESYEQIGGGNVPIRWAKSGTGAVIVELYRSGIFYYRIADENDGYKQYANGMDWSPQMNIQANTEYKIKLSAPNDCTVTDTSDSYFTMSIDG